MTQENTATIEDLLADHRIVKEAHRRCIGIAGLQEAGDTAQDALLVMWEDGTREDEDPEKLLIKNVDHFWQIFTTTARRIANTNRWRERDRGDLPLIEALDSDIETAHIPDYYEALDGLTPAQKLIAHHKLAGRSNKDIAKATKQRLDTVVKTLKQIRTEITLQDMIETGEINIMTLAEIIAKKASRLNPGAEIVIDRRKNLNDFQLKAIEKQLEAAAADHGCTITRSYHHEPIIERDGVRVNQADSYDFFLLVKPELPVNHIPGTIRLTV